MLFIVLSTAVAAISTVAVRAMKVIIDDSDPRWTYPPNQSFGAYSQQSPCTVCRSQPDPTLAMQGTWHDCTDAATATLNFTGTAVTVYAICPGPHDDGSYSAKLSFRLDGSSNGTFLDKQGGCDSYVYNYTVYSIKGLELGPHMLEVTNVPHDDPLNSSDLLLDYATIDDGRSSSAPHPHSNTNTKHVNIAAIVVPIVLVLAIIASLVAVRFIRHRVRRRDAHARRGKQQLSGTAVHRPTTLGERSSRPPSYYSNQGFSSS
ncbi:hypothetical protein EXIGLDRAFT_723907 [Exidia glandulosa HHB12029]|uniref:Uncharacterized protein n=1 Tax=Exidia glandulosa HHB12029 TaxID=1314781 RepID=A0A165MW94_EXIGL|nr:hypothetical protein EXIGLDRAFT_723907 [Exidia glandulosa HHB12029]